MNTKYISVVHIRFIKQRRKTLIQIQIKNEAKILKQLIAVLEKH